MNKTKIIATINDGTEDEQFLEDLYDRWVRMLRFNFSHGDANKVRHVMSLIANIANRGKHLSTVLDTKWIEIRTGKITEKIQFYKWDQIRLITDNSEKNSSEQSLFIDYPYLSEDVKIGQRIEIDSGAFHVRVIAKEWNTIIVEAENDALIGSNRHVNLPGVKLRLPSLTEKDKTDLLFAIEADMDFIAASFVRNRENVMDIREFLDANGGKNIKICSKIENQEAIENIDEIVLASDGVMVARGDLGIEIPMTRLPIYQKQIVKTCREQGKFVTVATHMLKSMTDAPTPTRAEVSDVFNAVMQKADTTMLSEETAIGSYKLEAVEAMRDITTEAELSLEYGHPDYESSNISERDKEKKYLIRSALRLAEDLDIEHILLFTKTGRLARFAAAYRPSHMIHAFTGNIQTLRYTNILFGINPHLLPNWWDHESNLWSAIETLQKNGTIKTNEKIIAITDIERNDEEIPSLEIIDLKKIKK
jgi:pyruvate kinase